MRVEEEQLVGLSGPSDRPADRVAVGLLRRLELGVAVVRTHPGIRVPVGIRRQSVGGPAKLIRPALRDGGDLQPARSPVFGLVALREDLHLANRLDVEAQHLSVVAGVHRRDAVHHDVVLTRPAETCAARGCAAGDDAGSQRDDAREVRVSDGQVLDLRGRDGKRALAARRLHQRRLRIDRDDLARPADLYRECWNRHAVRAADRDALPGQRLEPFHADFDRVGVGRDVGKHVVAGLVRDRRRRLGALGFADQDHRRAGDDAPLRVFDRAAHHARRDLRSGGGFVGKFMR